MQEAISVLGNRRFDVVLLDVKFPNESPQELVKFVKSKPIRTSILLMTGHAHEQDPDLLDMHRMGIDAVHSKPLDLGSLIQTVIDLENPLSAKRLPENDLN